MKQANKASLPSINKYAMLASYLHCCQQVVGGDGRVTTCTCEGWKAPQNPSQAHSLNTPCRACGHTLYSHGDIERLSPGELNRKFSLLDQIGDLYYSLTSKPANERANPETKEWYSSRLKVLTQSLKQNSFMGGYSPLNLPIGFYLKQRIPLHYQGREDESYPKFQNTQVYSGAYNNQLFYSPPSQVLPEGYQQGSSIGNESTSNTPHIVKMKSQQNANGRVEEYAEGANAGSLTKDEIQMQQPQRKNSENPQYSADIEASRQAVSQVNQQGQAVGGSSEGSFQQGMWPRRKRVDQGVDGDSEVASEGSIGSNMEWAVNPALGKPPFETPTIKEILKNFVEMNYRTAHPSYRTAATTIVNNLEKALNGVILKQRGIYESDSYNLNYSRWYYFTKAEGGQKYAVCEIFGREMLLLILSNTRYEELFGNVQFNQNAQAIIMDFFGRLRKQISQHDSIICHPNFQEKMMNSYSQEESVEKQPQRQPKPAKKAKQPKQQKQPKKRKRSNDENPSASPGKKKSEALSSGVEDEIIFSGNSRPRRASALQAAKNAVSLSLEGGIGFAESEPISSQDLMEKDTPANEHVHVTAERPFLRKCDLLGPEGSIDIHGRDNKAREEEEMGTVKVIMCKFDGNDRTSVILTHAKNLFSKQLPKMPKDYITRLVFDVYHETICLLRNDEMMGCCCFRPFPERDFVEIAFLAVNSSEQMKGYGTHLMNHLKEHVRCRNITNFLTYADNFAIGFFKRQGFNTFVTMPDKDWKGFIKDYQGGTIMHCRITLAVNYLELLPMIENQKRILYEQIRKVTRSHIVRKGIFRGEGKEPLDTENIPGIEETRWKTILDDAQREESDYIWMLRVIEILRQNRETIWPFLDAVDQNEVPEYYQIVKNPIHISLIEERVKSKKYYKGKDMFAADLKRMTENCKMFNPENSVYFKNAIEIESIISSLMNQ